MEGLIVKLVIITALAGVLYKVLGVIRVIVVVAVVGFGLMNFDHIEHAVSPWLDTRSGFDK